MKIQVQVMSVVIVLIVAPSLFAQTVPPSTNAPSTTQPAISISTASSGNSKTFLASHYDVPHGFGQMFANIDNDIFTCSVIRPLKEGDSVALMAASDQAWSTDTEPLLINGTDKVQYPIFAEVIYGTTGYVFLPAVLKFKVGINAGDVLHSKGSPAFDIEAKRPFKAGESIFVFYINSGILAAEVADDKMKSNDVQPLLTAFPSGQTDRRTQTIDAWRVVKDHVGQ